MWSWWDNNRYIKSRHKNSFFRNIFQLFETREYTSSFEQRSYCNNSTTPPPPKKSDIYIYDDKKHLISVIESVYCPSWGFIASQINSSEWWNFYMSHSNVLSCEASEWFQVTTGLKHGWTMHVLIPISGAHRLHNEENHWWGAIRNKVGLENKTRRDNLCRRPYSTFLKIQVSLRINTKKTKVIKLNSNLPDAIKTEEQYLQDEDTIRFTL